MTFIKYINPTFDIKLDYGVTDFVKLTLLQIMECLRFVSYYTTAVDVSNNSKLKASENKEYVKSSGR